MALWCHNLGYSHQSQSREHHHQNSNHSYNNRYRKHHRTRVLLPLSSTTSIANAVAETISGTGYEAGGVSGLFYTNSEQRPWNDVVHSRCTVILPAGMLLGADASQGSGPDQEQLLVETWPNEWQCIHLQPGGVLQTRFGAFFHDDFRGKRQAGDYWYARRSRRPGAFLRTLPFRFRTTVPNVTNRRTQVIYAPDVACLLARLELEPGAVVVEAGTGSGALTWALAVSVAPNGRVHTYECHEDRFRAARVELTQQLGHVWQPCWTQRSWTPAHLLYCYHQDVRVQPFYRTDKAAATDTRPLPASVQAVVLDMPEPHLVVEQAAVVLQPGLGVLAAFLPSVEQVWRLRKALGQSACFYDIQVLSNVSCVWQSMRPVQLQGSRMPTKSVWSRVSQRFQPNGAHTGYIVVARRQARLLDGESLLSTLVVAENKRARRT
jgi:tRNA (adenine57-N1/adenine58-N1)-methyltransferase